MPDSKIEPPQIFNLSLVNLEQVAFEELKKPGASKVRVKYLLDERHGSDKFFLRCYYVEKGGHTPLDKHVYEHQVYILQGEGLVREGSEQVPVMRRIAPGDSIYIPTNAVHQFINERDAPLVFLCLKVSPKLYEQAQGS